MTQDEERCQIPTTASAPSGKAQPDERIRLPFVRIYAPAPISRALHALSDFGHRQRDKVLSIAPDFVLENSTNIIGATQLVAELMAFKSTGADLVLPENQSKPLHYLLDPPKNVIGALVSRSAFEFKPEALLKPSFYKQTLMSYIDLAEATKIDLQYGKLINHWQARSGLCGITAMAVATLLPNAKDDPNETERMTDLYEKSPYRYAAARLGQALYVPGWGQHKTQFAGLGMLGAGVCSFLSGFRNVSGSVVGKQKYYFNAAHSIGGLVTALAGTQLMFGVDNQQSWQNYGATQFLRMPILAMTIGKKFKNFDVGAQWYTAAAAGFQTKNLIAYLIGGAERDANGNIIDKKAIREKATLKSGETTDVPALLYGNSPQEGPPDAKVSDVAQSGKIQAEPETIRQVGT